MTSLLDYGNYRLNILNHSMVELREAVNGYLKAKGILNDDGTLEGIHDSESMAVIALQHSAISAMMYWNENKSPSAATNEMMISAMRHIVIDFELPRKAYNEEWVNVMQYGEVFADVHNGGFQLNEWLLLKQS